MIHFIGDSHASVFSGKGVKEESFMQPTYPLYMEGPHIMTNLLENIKAYRIGPATAYKLYNKISIIENLLLNEKVSKLNDNIFFCFGEVDIRVHLIHQSNIQNKNIEIIVKECVDEYIKTILYFKNIGYNKIGVWSPIATKPDELFYDGPFLSDEITRNKITELFCDYLKEVSLKNGIYYESVFSEMLLNNTYKTNEYYIMDNIHLSQTARELFLPKFKKYFT